MRPLNRLDAGVPALSGVPRLRREREYQSLSYHGTLRAACVPGSVHPEGVGHACLYERCAAIDVGKDEIAVAARMPGDGPGGRVTIKRAFKAFLRGDGRGRPVAGLARGHACGDGGDRGLFHAGLLRPGRARGLRAGPDLQRRAREERAGPQNGLRRCRVAGAPAGVRAAGRQFHPAGRDQGGPGRGPLPHQDRRPAGQRDRPARQHLAGRRDQDRPRWPGRSPPGPAGR
jgi:hypothetical protein